MKKFVTIILLVLTACTSVLYADNYISIPSPPQGLFLTATVSPVTVGFGIGYRNNGIEIGSSTSSSAIPAGTIAMFLGHPGMGLAVGAMAFGGIDAYARYDLIPSPGYNLSVGIGGNVIYCMLSGIDISTSFGLSLHASFTTKDGATLFVDSGIPVFGLEYSKSHSSDQSNQTDSGINSGWLLNQPKTSFVFSGILTTRVGIEFDI